MIRLSTATANSHLLSLLFRSQQTLHELQVQVSTEKVSQTYSGIAREAGRLIKLENTRATLDRFKVNNELMMSRLDAISTTVVGIESTISNLRQTLLTSGNGQPLDRTRVDDLQRWAFRAMQDMQDYLNSDLAGRFLFAGSRATTRPVDLGLTTLEDFQAIYDGAAVKYPETRDAHLQDFSFSTDGAGNSDWLQFEEDAGAGLSRISSTTTQFVNVVPGSRITIEGTPGGLNDGTFTVVSVGGGGTTIDVATVKFEDEGPVAATLSGPDNLILTPAETGALTFASGATETLTATIPGSLAGLPEGAAFTVAGTATNDGTYTVLSNDGTTVTIASKKLLDQGSVGAEVPGSISSVSYYRGDEIAVSHAVDADRRFALDLSAVHPAFEKAIRAMGLLAQGVFGTSGGLDQSPERVEQAIALLNSALDVTAEDERPFGQERKGNIETVEMTIGFEQVLLDETNRRHNELIAMMDGNVLEIENVDTTETISKLLDVSRSVEASLQVIAMVRELSLTNFL
jgi:flagellin-like hook-associated protein FlgL